MNRIGHASPVARPAVSKFVFLVLVLVLVFSLGTVPAQAKATTYISNQFLPTELYVYIPCALGGMGETVILSGPLHVLMITTLDGNGGFMSRTLFQPQGISGTGLTSGVRYQATGETGETLTGKVGSVYTYVNNFKIIGQGPGNNFMVHENFHYTLNPDGTMTAYVDNISVECR